MTAYFYHRLLLDEVFHFQYHQVCLDFCVMPMGNGSTWGRSRQSQVP